jgi:hypothetical protein
MRQHAAGDWVVFSASVVLVGLFCLAQPGFFRYYSKPLASTANTRISWLERVIYAAALSQKADQTGEVVSSPAKAARSKEVLMQPACEKKNPEALPAPGLHI